MPSSKGARFALELQYRDRIVGALQQAVDLERDGDLLVDRNRFEPLMGRIVSERTIVRGGRVRRVRFFVRLFGFTEPHGWLLAAGFAAVDGYDQNAAPLPAASRRLLVVAQRFPPPAQLSRLPDPCSGSNGKRPPFVAGCGISMERGQGERRNMRSLLCLR